MLTAKQESFAAAVASGKTQADAYRSAYAAENMKENSVWTNASKLMADAKVAQRVEELRKALENKQLWTREMSVKALIGAYKEGNPTAKIAAVKELNVMHGYAAPTRLDVTTRTLEPVPDDEFLG